MQHTLEWSLVVGGSMVMDFMGHPYPQIYIPTNIQQSNELSYIVMQQTGHPRN